MIIIDPHRVRLDALGSGQAFCAKRAVLQGGGGGAKLAEQLGEYKYVKAEYGNRAYLARAGG